MLPHAVFPFHYRIISDASLSLKRKKMPYIVILRDIFVCGWSREVLDDEGFPGKKRTEKQFETEGDGASAFGGDDGAGCRMQ